MPKLRDIDNVVEMAIPLSSCPVKKASEIKRREWLKNQIQLLINANTPVLMQHGPSEFK